MENREHVQEQVEESRQPEKRAARWIWGAAAVCGILVLAAVVGLLAARISGPAPEEVARQWALDNVDWAGEQVAGLVVRALGVGGLKAVVLRELGGEWVEDRVHEHLAWSFSEASPHGSGGHVVVATASVDFAVSSPAGDGQVAGSVPFRLVIDGGEVVMHEVVLAGVSVDVDVAGGAVVEEAVESAVESVVESKDKVSDGVKDFLGQ